MAFWSNRSGNNNNCIQMANLTLRDTTTAIARPVVPSKPKCTQSKAIECDGGKEMKCTLGTTTKSTHSITTQVASFHHYTPKLWSSSQYTKVHDRSTASLKDRSSSTDTSKSRFSSKWRSVPRIQNFQERLEKFQVSGSGKLESETTQQNPRSSPSHSNSNVSKLKEISKNDKNMQFLKIEHAVPPVPETKPNKSAPKVVYRKSFARDPKSPGFGSLMRMWDTMSSQPETFSPQPFKVGSQNEKSNAKPRSNTVTMSTTASSSAWHHVNSPKKTKDWTRVRSQTESQIASEAFGILSPKPFRTVPIHESNSDFSAKERNTFNFDFVEKDITQDSTNQCDNLKTLPFNGDHQPSSQSDDSTRSSGSFNVEVGVYNELRKDEMPSQSVSLKSNIKETDTHGPQSLSTSKLNNATTNCSPQSQASSRHTGAFSPTSTQTNISNQLPADNKDRIIGYVDNQVLPSHRINSISRLRRNYHESNNNAISSTPGESTKRLQVTRPRSSTPPASLQLEAVESSSCTPPPLPPDNTVGRRSMINSTKNRLQFVQNLEENFVKAYQGRESRKLNDIEVEFTTESNLNKAATLPMQRASYNDDIIHSDNELQRRNRSGSGTSEEGLSLGSKKQKNVKKKLQSLFSKDDSKSVPLKESQDPVTSFDKERNKKKRISGRFLRKKNKDSAKVSKSERNSGGASPEAAPYSESEGGLAVSPDVPTLSSADVDNPKSSPDYEPSTQSDVTLQAAWKVLPTGGLSGRRKSYHEITVPDGDKISPAPDGDKVPPVPLARSKPSSVKETNSQGHLKLALTLTSRTSSTDSCEDAVEQKPKKSSFLHGSQEPGEGPGRATRPKSGPPTLPTFRRTLSEPMVLETTNISPPITRPKPLPRKQDLNGPSPAKRDPAPLLGVVDSSPRSETGGALTPPVASRLPKRPSLRTNASEPSFPVQSTADIPTDAVCYPLDPNEGVYMVADIDPLTEESIYESIPATSTVQPSPSQTDQNVSMFLKSEPLYQVYRNRTITRASTKRPIVVHRHKKEVDITGEEWESELMSEDLGTCTLWRCIPEVEASGWAAKLTTEEVKLQQAQFEVLTSQASYMRSLNILLNHFMRDHAMESPDCLPAADRRHLFSNIETVCGVERRFLQELENHFWKDIKFTRTCEIIAQYAKTDFKVYVLYIQNQMYQDRVLTKLQRSHDKFCEELSRLESSPGCNKLPLLSFLLLPMQRVTRLPLLVSAIVNAADAAGDAQMCKTAKHTLGVVNKLVKKCNEGARKMQQTEELAEIARQLDYSSSVRMFALVSQSRSLVKKGEMTVSMATDTKKSTKPTKLWLFLFTDVLFIAKKKSHNLEFGSSPRYEVIDWANRQFLAVNEQAVTENVIFLVILENQAGRRVEMSLTPLEQNELPRWENALNPPTVGAAGESIYEAWDCPQYSCVAPYEGRQPDELSLEVGDVMQVLKKTSDGWLEGERLRDGEGGWFPSENCEEIKDEHVRARNMKNLYRNFVYY